MIGVLRDMAMTINDGDNELINGEQDGKRKENPSKTRSTQFQGKRMKFVTISAMRDDVTTEENARTVPTAVSTVVKKVTSPEKYINKHGKGSG